MPNFKNFYKGGRPKLGWRSGSLFAYKEFKRQNPTIKLTSLEYYEVIENINQELLNHILEGEVIDLHKFITIYVNKYKYDLSKHADGVPFSKILSIDWGESQKQDKLVYYLDTETDKYKFSFQFRSHRAIKDIKEERKQNLRAIPNNSVKKQLQQKIIGGFTDYIQYEIIKKDE